MVEERLRAEYVLPLRWTDDDDGADELSAYLEDLVATIDVTVVDGSPAALYAAHERALPPSVRHLRPAPWPGGNGKVAGVMTGIALARHDLVVLGDDDVRYERAQLARVVEALTEADIVRPQNYFTALPWHARWDTARSLLNRSLAADYPGTLGVRRSTVLAAGGYRGDVLFENLELIRTVRAAGGRELRADDVFVGRRPPSVRHFLGQRVRQAYDDFAQPWRLGAELLLLPLGIWAARRPARLLVLLAAACLLAERGRRRAGGAAVFPPTSALWAPAWLAERAVCVWVAVGARVRGGARYGGGRLRAAATPMRQLRRSAPARMTRRGNAVTHEEMTQQKEQP